MPEEEQDTDMRQDSNAAGHSTTCPLFMEGLPTNFAQHAQLAALASLLEDNDDKTVETNNETLIQHHRDQTSSKSSDAESPANTTLVYRSNTVGGGGKVKRIKGRQQRQGTLSPYTVDKKKVVSSSSAGAAASLGEAQLFMKMWKL